MDLIFYIISFPKKKSFPVDYKINSLSKNDIDKTKALIVVAIIKQFSMWVSEMVVLRYSICHNVWASASIARHSHSWRLRNSPLEALQTMTWSLFLVKLITLPDFVFYFIFAIRSEFATHLRSSSHFLRGDNSFFHVGAPS